LKKISDNAKKISVNAINDLV